MTSPLSLDAVRELLDVVGAEHVWLDGGTLQAAGTATYATTSKVHAVVRPGSRAEVQACVRIANRFGFALHPISSGKNWGYGSKSPCSDGVLLDLGRMTRIVDFNEELAYVTIEPGVTQRQLLEYLAAQGSNLWMDATGASPECSLIGNTLERGFGHTPMGDHCANACGLEIVLPTGDCIETGFARFGGAKAAGLARWGVGPSLDGLFSQSNFGIVTRMTIWLMPKPESFEAFFFSCADESALAGVVDALRPLRLEGTLRSVVHIGNDYKILAATSLYPWAEVGGRAPLDRDYVRRVRKERAFGAWNASGGVYGSVAQVREAKRRVRRALRGRVTRLHFVNDRMLRLAKRLATPLKLLTGIDARQTTELLTPAYNLLKGIPSDSFMRSAYWRKPDVPSGTLDPDRDGCGLLWCSPVVPNRGDEVQRVTDFATRTLLEDGFEPQISVSLATERAAICVITIAFDRHVQGEDQRALACHDRLTRELISQGYPPYRLGTSTMHYAQQGDAYGEIVATLKAALDPKGVLSPGRYDTTAAEAAMATSAAKLTA